MLLFVHSISVISCAILNLNPNKHFYPNLFGSYPPLQVILDAYEIKPPDDPICYGSRDGDCKSWHDSIDGGKALANLNREMKGKMDWMSKYPPTEENVPIVLCMLRPPQPMTPRFVQVLVKSIHNASNVIKRSKAYKFTQFIAGSYGEILYSQIGPSEPTIEVALARQSIVNGLDYHNDFLPDYSQSHLKTYSVALYGLLAALNIKGKGNNYQEEHSLILLRAENISMLRKSKMFSDLPLETLLGFLDGLLQFDYSFIHYLYTIFIDFVQQKMEHVTLPMMLAQLVELALHDHPEGHWSKVGPAFKALIIEKWSLRQATEGVKFLCEQETTPLVLRDQLKCHDASKLRLATFSEVYWATMIGINTLNELLVDVEVHRLYEREMQRLRMWFKVRLILHHTDQTHLVINPMDLTGVERPELLWAELRRNEKLMEAFSHPLLDIFTAESMLIPQPKKEMVDETLKGLLRDPRKYHSILESVTQTSQTISLTLLHLTGKISLEELVNALPKITPSRSSMSGIYASNVVQNVPPPWSNYFHGGKGHDDALLFIDVLRELLVNRPKHCPISVAKLLALMKQMLILHTVTLHLRFNAGYKLYAYFIDRLEMGESLFLPANIYRHGYSYSITLLDYKHGQHHYRLQVFNSGAGIDSHQKDARGLYMPFREFLITKEILEQKNYLCNPMTPTDLIESIGYPIEGKEIWFNGTELQKWAKKPQKGGSCHSKLISFWLRMQWETPLQGIWFKAFRFNLHSNSIRAQFSNFKYEVKNMAEISTKWPVDRSKAVCQSLCTEVVPLHRAILRHFGLRLLLDINKLASDDYGAADLVLGAVLDDKKLLDCLGITNNQISAIKSQQMARNPISYPLKKLRVSPPQRSLENAFVVDTEAALSKKRRTDEGQEIDVDRQRKRPKLGETPQTREQQVMWARQGADNLGPEGEGEIVAEGLQIDPMEGVEEGHPEQQKNWLGWFTGTCRKYFKGKRTVPQPTPEQPQSNQQNQTPKKSYGIFGW